MNLKLINEFRQCLCTCMNDDMFGEVPDIDKRFVAGLALVGSYVVMMADVIGQLAGLHKPVRYNFTIRAL